MAILGRSMRERNPVAVAGVGLVVLLLLLASAYEYSNIVDHFTKRTYVADFTETGGLNGGEDVRVSGVKVGVVKKITLERGYVRVSFAIGKDIPLGEDTRATIATATALGTKDLQIDAAGPGRLTGDIPTDRTTPPYDVTQALSQLTDETGQIDTAQLAASFDTLSQAFSTSAPDVKTALAGVSKLSTTIASRDTALRQLLSDANGVTKILADRDAQFTALFADGDLLLQELNSQRQQFEQLLVNVTTVVHQLNGLVNDNKATIGPLLTQLDGTLDILNSHTDDIVAAINGLKRYATGLGEAVGGGPFFYAFVQNLPPTNLATAGTGTGLLAGLLPAVPTP